MCVFFSILLLLLLFFRPSVCLIRMQRCYFWLRPSNPFIYFLFFYKFFFLFLILFIFFSAFPLWIFSTHFFGFRFCHLHMYISMYVYVCVYPPHSAHETSLRSRLALKRSCVLFKKRIYFACGLWMSFDCMLTHTHLCTYKYIYKYIWVHCFH